MDKYIQSNAIGSKTQNMEVAKRRITLYQQAKCKKKK